MMVLQRAVFVLRSSCWEVYTRDFLARFLAANRARARAPHDILKASRGVPRCAVFLAVPA
jgi:hypothetical protein